MRVTLFAILAACGGGDEGGGGSSFDATVNVDGAPSTFSASCQLTESDTYLDITATSAGLGFEIKWKKALITMTGTYPTGGIVDDIVLFAKKGDTILSASGSVTFTTYQAPAVMAGTFDLTATGVTASGSFDCRDAATP